MDVKAAPNGVATIEDRILRITGYYGYYPGYSSQKMKNLPFILDFKPAPEVERLSSQEKKEGEEK